MPVPEIIYLYRMVHWQNVEYVLHHGICCREHPEADPALINIGHRQLIVDRHDYPVPLANAATWVNMCLFTLLAIRPCCI